MHVNPTALQHKQKPTCMLALLELSREMIQQYCQFAIQPYKATPMVTVLGPGRLLLQFITQYTLHCRGNETVTQPGCSICVLRIPCNCLFTTDIYHYYSQVSRCDNASIPTTTLEFPINIPYLQLYFNTTELLPDHQQLLNYLPQILLPNLTMESSEYEATMGLIQDTLLEMNTVVENAVNHTPIFMAISDKIADDIKNDKLQLHPKSIMSYIEMTLIFLNPIISILALLGMLYLYCKWRTLATALALFSGPRQAAAASIQARIWDARPANAIVTSHPLTLTLPPWKEIQWEENTFKTGVLTVISLILVLIILYHFVVARRL